MTRKGNSSLAQYKAILLYMSKEFGINQTDPNKFQMFNSSEFNDAFKDQIFKDSTVKLVDVGDKDSYDKWLGKQYLDDLEALADCPYSTDPTDPTDPDIKGSAGVVSSLALSIISAAMFTVLSAWSPTPKYQW